MRISDWSSDVCSSDLDRQLFVLKIAGAIHASILLHQLFQIELRCDHWHISLTFLIRRIDSRQPHPLFIERFERIAVDNARVLDVDRNWLAIPCLHLIEQRTEGENRENWQRDLLISRPFFETSDQHLALS